MFTTKRRVRTSVLAAAATSLSLVACVQQDAAPEDLDRVLPTAEQMAIKLPQNNARAVGQIATWYVATRDVTRSLNGSTAWVLGLVHTIVQLPVTSAKDDTFTWGPGSSPLDPAEYKLDVRVVGDGTYEYALSGRSKLQAGSEFEVVIDGVADPRPGELRGNGSFLVDFEAGKRVNPLDAGDGRGTLEVNYDLAERHLDLSLESTNDSGEPVAVDYAYNEGEDRSGDMVFDVSNNAGGGVLLESVTLRSRWLATGAGRADARIVGGDLGGLQVTASECWDVGFRRVFYGDSIDLTPIEGEDTACVFATADLPQ